MGVSTVLEAGQSHLFTEEEGMEGRIFALAGGEAAVHSSRSPARSTPNEDSAAVIAMTDEWGILAVADGLGGAPAGQQASAVAVQCLVEAIRNATKEGHDPRWGILNGFEAANQKVLALGIGAATTLTVVELGEASVRGYHVGDSQVLVTGQRGKVKFLSIPHSPVGYGVESGLLDEDDAMHHEERHVVSNAIGSEEMRIDVGPPVVLAPRDTVILASDGLFDNLHVKEIVSLVRKGPLKRVARELAEKAAARMTGGEEGEPSKPDDLTFVVFRPRRAAAKR